METARKWRLHKKGAKELDQVCTCCGSNGHQEPHTILKGDCRTKKSIRPNNDDPYLVTHGLPPVHQLLLLRLRRQEKKKRKNQRRAHTPEEVRISLNTQYGRRDNSVNNSKAAPTAPRIVDKNKSRRPRPEETVLHFIRHSRLHISPLDWDIKTVFRAAETLPAQCPMSLEQEASSLAMSSLQCLAWGSVQCPQAMEQAESLRLQEALHQEDKLRQKWQQDQTRLATVSSSLQIKQVTWLCGVEERHESIKVEEAVRARLQSFLEGEAAWRQTVHDRHAHHFYRVEETVALQVLSLEELHGARRWEEEQAILAIYDMGQRSAAFDLLLKQIGGATQGQRQKFWAILHKEEVLFWLMTHGAAKIHELAFRKQLQRISAYQASECMDAARRLRDKDQAVMSACRAELSRLVNDGAREILRCRTWKDVQLRALARSEESVHDLIRPSAAMSREVLQREMERTAVRADDARARYRRRRREFQQATDKLDQQQQDFIEAMMQEHRDWYGRCRSEFERRMKLEAKHRNDVHTGAQDVTRRIFAQEQEQFRQGMEQSFRQVQSHFSYYVLARLCYLDHHYVFQLKKWEELRTRFRRESQKEMARIKDTWDEWREGMNRRLNSELIRLVSEGKEGESGWQVSRQTILSACIDKEAELQLSTAEHFQAVKSTIEASFASILGSIAPTLGDGPDGGVQQEEQQRQQNGAELCEALHNRWSEVSKQGQDLLVSAWEENVSETLRHLEETFPTFMAVFQRTRDQLPVIKQRELDSLAEFGAVERGRQAAFAEKCRSDFMSAMSELTNAESQMLREELFLEFSLVQPPSVPPSTPKSSDWDKGQDDGGEEAFFRAPTIQAHVLEQETPEQLRLCMSYARLTNRRAERMVSLFHRRVESFVADLNRKYRFRAQLSSQRQEDVRVALLEWESSAEVTVDRARERLQGDDTTFVNHLQTELRVKVDLEVESMRVMDTQLIATADRYTAFATEAITETKKQMEQTRFGFERHEKHLQEAYDMGLAQAATEHRIMETVAWRHQHNMVEVDEYMWKQRQSWLSALRSTTADYQTRIDHAISSHHQKVTEAFNAAMPSIRELQAISEPTKAHQAQLNRHATALFDSLKKASQSKRSSLIKAMTEVEERAERAVVRFEAKDLPQYLRLAATKAEHLTSVHGPEVEGMVRKRKQEERIADGSLAQKVQTFGEAMDKANARFEKEIRSRLKLHAQEQALSVESFQLASRARMAVIKATSISKRHLPHGCLPARLLNALSSHFETRHALLTSLHAATHSALSTILSSTFSHLAPAACALKRQEERTADRMVVIHAVHWTTTQAVIRHLTQVVMHGELTSAGSRVIEEGIRSVKEVHSRGKEERTGSLATAFKEMDDKLEDLLQQSSVTPPERRDSGGQERSSFLLQEGLDSSRRSSTTTTNQASERRSSSGGGSSQRASSVSERRSRSSSNSTDDQQQRLSGV